MKERRFLAKGICLLVMLFLFSGCGKETAQTPDVPVVKTQRVAFGGVNGISYAGEVRGRYESQLAFQVGGKIAARNIDLGSVVGAGDVLMQLDPKDVMESVNMGAAQVAAAEAQLRLAETNRDRYRQLYEQQAVSAAVYDQYKTTYDAALATYRQAQAQYAQSDNALGYTYLQADGAGVISAVNAEIGQVVAAGQSVVTLVKTDELEVEINVPENRLADMKPGRSVHVAFWAMDDRQVSGVVREVAPMADSVARTYKARIRLPEPPQELRLGMTARVDADAAGEENYALVPLAALYQAGERPQVWIVADGKVHLREIVVEAFGDNQVKVTSGLKAGDVIVVAGVHKLREGQEVRVMEGDAS